VVGSKQGKHGHDGGSNNREKDHPPHNPIMRLKSASGAKYGSCTSKISVSQLMAGDGLRMGSGEPASLPTDAKEVVAMCGMSLRQLAV
jgi:hypothetical protein